MSSHLPLTGVLRLGRPSGIWFKPALSVVVAAPPNLALLVLGRLDLAMYTRTGSLCALYAHNRPYAAHNRPYAARARTLAWVVLGALVGLVAAVAVPDRPRQRVVRVGRSGPRTLAATGRSQGPHPDHRTGDTTEGVRP